MSLGCRSVATKFSTHSSRFSEVARQPRDARTTDHRVWTSRPIHVSWENIRPVWVPPRLSAISCFLPRLLCLVSSFLQRLSVWFSFLPRVSRTVSLVSAGSKRSRTVSAETKYDGQSLQEAKISWLVHTLCWCTISPIVRLRLLSINSCICVTKAGSKSVAWTPCSSLVFCRKAAAKRTTITEVRTAAVLLPCCCRAAAMRLLCGCYVTSFFY